MAHTRKKHGERKDKKVARMHQAAEFKTGMAHEEKPTHDQKDIQTFKPGHASDKSNPQKRARAQKGQK
jgi:hypothetical protein